MNFSLYVKADCFYKYQFELRNFLHTIDIPNPISMNTIPNTIHNITNSNILCNQQLQLQTSLHNNNNNDCNNQSVLSTILSNNIDHHHLSQNHLSQCTTTNIPKPVTPPLEMMSLQSHILYNDYNSNDTIVNPVIYNTNLKIKIHLYTNVYIYKIEYRIEE